MTIKRLHSHINKNIPKEKVNVSFFRGQTIGIDVYGWLHKAKYATSLQLKPGQEAIAHINYCIDLTNMLLRKGVKPYFVFDGAFLPSKKETEKHRFEIREKNSNYGKNISLSTLPLQIPTSKTVDRKAHEKHISSIDVTPQFAYGFLKCIIAYNNKKKDDAKKLSFIVAPYEADAQLAYLANEKIIQVVQSEDGDFIAYNTPNILFKMDKYGNGDLVTHDILTTHPKSPFYGYSNNEILYTCLLAGCDYAENLYQLGINTACSLVRTHHSLGNIFAFLFTMPKYKLDLPCYIMSFIKALLTFSYQLVWDPKKNEIRNLTILPSNFNSSSTSTTSLDFLGPVLDKTIFQEIAYGIRDPITNKKYIDKHFIIPNIVKDIVDDVLEDVLDDAVHDVVEDAVEDAVDEAAKETAKISTNGLNYDFTELPIEIVNLAFGIDTDFILQLVRSCKNSINSIEQTPEDTSKELQTVMIKRQRPSSLDKTSDSIKATDIPHEQVATNISKLLNFSPVKNDKTGDINQSLMSNDLNIRPTNSNSSKKKTTSSNSSKKKTTSSNSSKKKQVLKDSKVKQAKVKDVLKK